MGRKRRCCKGSVVSRWISQGVREDGPRIGAEGVETLSVGTEDHAGDAVRSSGTSLGDGFGVALEEGRVDAAGV